MSLEVLLLQPAIAFIQHEIILKNSGIKSPLSVSLLATLFTWHELKRKVPVLLKKIAGTYLPAQTNGSRLLMRKSRLTARSGSWIGITSLYSTTLHLHPIAGVT